VPAKLVRGPYTPTDRAAILEQVTKGVAAGVLSLETGIRMLVDAGFPIEDIEQEIKQIQARAFEQAKHLADATGSSKAVGDYLGIEVDPDPVPPPVILPGAAAAGLEGQPPAGDEGTGRTGGNPAQGSGGNE
jgi:hypothetical protein